MNLQTKYELWTLYINQCYNFRWAGGGPIFPSSRKATTFAPDVEDGDDDENDSTGQKNNKKKRRPEIDPETARQQGK